MQDLTAQQSRQLIDCEQLYIAYRDADRELASRFAGAMSWKTVKGRTYLYRKSASVWKSLGPQDDRTRAIHAQFHAGRDAARLRRRTLEERIRAMAPVNRAMRLGRVPAISARIIRRIERAHLLGAGLRIVGTHALYAYENLGGVHFGQEAMTTMDIDLLYDARISLKLVSTELKADGLIGLLQAQDRSFRPTASGSFRAVNDQGFMVDLIAPSTRSPAMRQWKSRLGERADDLAAAEIDGLAWLENVPALDRIVIDERGYPLTMVVPDPRAFMCHKAWMAGRDDRDPLKRRRDHHQARTLAAMLATRIPSLRLDDPVLQAVPVAVLALGRAEMEWFGASAGAVEQEDWDG